MSNIKNVQTDDPASPEVEFDEGSLGFSLQEMETPKQAIPAVQTPPAVSEARFDADLSDGVSFDDYGLKDPFADVGLVQNLNATQPTTLQAPPPRPGYAQRFVVFEVNGRADSKNIALQIQRKHWRPRRFRRGEVPGYSFTKVKGGADEYVIMINGHVLCERRIEIGEQFKALNRRAVENMNRSERDKYETEGGKDGVGVQYNNATQTSKGYRPVPVAPNRNQ